MNVGSQTEKGWQLFKSSPFARKYQTTWYEAEYVLKKFAALLLKGFPNYGLKGGSYAYYPANEQLTAWEVSDGAKIKATLLEILTEYADAWVLEEMILNGSDNDQHMVKRKMGQADYEGSNLRGEALKLAKDALIEAGRRYRVRINDPYERSRNKTNKPGSFFSSLCVDQIASKAEKFVGDVIEDPENTSDEDAYEQVYTLCHDIGMDLASSGDLESSMVSYLARAAAAKLGYPPPDGVIDRRKVSHRQKSDLAAALKKLKYASLADAVNANNWQNTEPSDIEAKLLGQAGF
jgi:hypothetical protein